MKRLFRLSVVFSLVASAAAAFAIEPANPKANAKARAILNYLEKLDNLLWVYGPNHGQKTAAYYAGDRYVDIVGLDAYTDFVDPAHIKGYDEVVALGKPFAFTEFGPHGSQNPPGDYDYRRFIDGVTKNFPKTTFFLSWHARWSIARNNNGKELLSHPWVVNRGELPAAIFSGK